MQQKKSQCLGLPVQGDYAVGTETPVKGIGTGSRNNCWIKDGVCQYSSEPLSHLTGSNFISSLGILFPSLSIPETSVAPQITEELPLCFGSPCWPSCQSCRRRWNGIGSLPVLFRGCGNMSLRGNPVIHSFHHTAVPLGGPVLSPRCDQSVRGTRCVWTPPSVPPFAARASASVPRLSTLEESSSRRHSAGRTLPSGFYRERSTPTVDLSTCLE